MIIAITPSFSKTLTNNNTIEIKCGIKWVNDLYFEDKKVCGILTEGVIDKNGLQRFVLGIGINIVANSFPDDIQNIAGALFNGDKIEEDKVFDDPTLMKTPIVRNGKQATVGFRPEVWATWE